MDKEVLSKRIKILNEIELLKEKCGCDGHNKECPNCMKISNLGNKLNKLVRERNPGHGEVQVPQKNGKPRKSNAGRKKETYPEELTLEEYKYLRSIKLSDQNIADVFETTAHFVRRFKEENGIRSYKRQVKRNMAIEERNKLKRIIIRERLRIKSKNRGVE